MHDAENVGKGHKLVARGSLVLPLMIAADIMTENPRTIRSSAAVRDALDALQTLQIRHLPVIDEEGNLVGMLSDRDLGPLMSQVFEGSGGSDGRVSDFMSSDVISVDLDEDVNAIIERMLEERIGAVPVVDGDGSVRGIVSYVDILRTLGAPPEPRRKR